MESLTAYAQISCFLIQNVALQIAPQFNYQQMYYPNPMQYYSNAINNQYQQPEPVIRTGKKKKKHYKKRRHTKNKSIFNDEFSCESESKSSNSDSSSESEDCSCSCDQCTHPQKCCIKTCRTCPAPNPGVVFVPYPYPMIITQQNKKMKSDQKEVIENSVHPETTTIEQIITKSEITATEPTKTESNITQLNKSSTTEVETSTPDAAEKSNDGPKHKNYTEEIDALYHQLRRRAPRYNFIESSKNRRNSNMKYVMTSLRRLKEDWLPEYGIVPIPDSLAAELIMSHNERKSIQAHRDTEALDDGQPLQHYRRSRHREGIRNPYTQHLYQTHRNHLDHWVPYRPIE